MGTLITPWHGDHDIHWNRSQLVPAEFKSGPSYVKHRVSNFTVKQRGYRAQATEAKYQHLKSLTFKCWNFPLLVTCHVQNRSFWGSEPVSLITQVKIIRNRPTLIDKFSFWWSEFGRWTVCSQSLNFKDIINLIIIASTNVIKNWSKMHATAFHKLLWLRIALWRKELPRGKHHYTNKN